LRLWALANYCRAGIKSLRGTGVIRGALNIDRIPTKWMAVLIKVGRSHVFYYPL
jgi:hypothetical protein